MGDYAEAWRTVHNLVAQFAALTELEPVLKRAADAEAFIEQHAANVDEAKRLQASIDSLRAELTKIPEEIRVLSVSEQEKYQRMVTSLNASFESQRASLQAGLDAVRSEHRATCAAIDREVREGRAEAARVRESAAAARAELANAQADLATLKKNLGRV